MQLRWATADNELYAEQRLRGDDQHSIAHCNDLSEAMYMKCARQGLDTMHFEYAFTLHTPRRLPEASMEGVGSGCSRAEKKKKESRITPTPKKMGLSARRSGGGEAMVMVLSAWCYVLHLTSV